MDTKQSSYQVKVKKPTGEITKIGPSSKATQDKVAIDAFRVYVNETWSVELVSGDFEFYLVKDDNETISRM